MILRRALRPLGALSPNAWTCPSCTKASLPSRLPRPQRRSVHQVPALAYDETFTRDGVPGLFSRNGYELAWTTYQRDIVHKLNELVAGEPIANKRPKELVLEFARDPMNASLFNHASMAHNNHFFFNGLSTSPQPLAELPGLQRSLQATFGSIDTLRTTMLDTAAAMFGPGFVWLVWTRDTKSSAVRKGDWRLLTTYIAGTPYPEAGYRQQGIDMNTNDAGSFAEYQVANNVGAFGPHSQGGKESAKVPPGGTSLVPVVCVNTWQHAYLYDYGTSGKRRYLSDWWDAIDWSVVQANTPEGVLQGAWYDATGRGARR